MVFPSSLVVLLGLVSSPAHAADLLTTLRSSGAGRFADAIQADPKLASIFSAPTVKTIFAPIDSVMTGVLPAMRALWLRDEAQEQQAQYSYHAVSTISDIASERSPPGEEFVTDSTLVPSKTGKKQVIIADNGLRESGNGSGPSRFAMDRRQDPSLPPLQLFTGLGNSVNVLQRRIPYDDGFIYTIDGLFTIPSNLSFTSSSRPDISTFASLLSSTNLTSSLDSAVATTFFIPSNTALAGTAHITPDLLLGHAVQGFLGYLPSLAAGQTLTSMNGETLKVTISGGSYYINDAKIISSNVILENGVAHVIDKTLSSTTTSPPLFTGSGSSTLWSSVKYVGGLALGVALANIIAT